MNNTLENETKELSAADVVAFLTEQAARLARAVGKEYTFVGCWVGNPAHGQPVSVEWRTYSTATAAHLTGDDFDELIADTLKAADPVVRAAAIRAEAAKLLAEAEAIAPVRNLCALDDYADVRPFQV